MKGAFKISVYSWARTGFSTKYWWNWNKATDFIKNVYRWTE